MDPKYIEPDESNEFFTEERCHILELLNNKDDRSQSIARARVEVGTTTAWHQLKETLECFYILEGTGTLEVGSKAYNVKKGDVMRIPADTPQRVINNGIEDLIFLCFCTPAFSADAYETLE